MKISQIKTENDTKNYACQLAKTLKGGEIIALEGELGAGKTTLTQYLSKSLGVKNQVTSPTFVLMKVYSLSPKLKVQSLKQLVHVDCYRLDDPQELFYLGIEEYLNKNDTIVVIEWADKIKKYLQGFKNIIWIKIKVKDKQKIFNIK